ncbi:MAG: Sir2 family NAD-dependent protein deacetylase [Candidatus Thiodiazotropha taylori]
MSEPIDKRKIVILTGAGVSAESGLQTFRDTNGLWNNYNLNDVATPQAWEDNPKLVLEFYNERRKLAAEALPNEAHLSLARLEDKYKVVVVTQNVDDLHERAGSTNVIHVHGMLRQARSTVEKSLVYEIGPEEINLGNLCEKGSQLRPNIVWFGEDIENYEISLEHIRTASKVLIIGTSLTVSPAANFAKKARFHAEKIVVQPELEKKPYGYTWLRGTAVKVVPHVVKCWLDGRNVT